MKRSAGVLLHRRREEAIEVLLVHPGGPFWAKKDDGAWSVPKGEYEPGEDPRAAAARELEEETGLRVELPAAPLGTVRQPGGKEVVAWAVEGELDPERLHSNTFSMEWPPRSGRVAEFPEVDRAGWFRIEEARRKILKGQLPLLDALLAVIGR